MESAAATFGARANAARANMRIKIDETPAGPP
jgi:hypothetical protein